jgi:predicted molibdopterin-dependent oxidoreductase YjgC
MTPARQGLLVRVADAARPVLSFTLDGKAAQAQQGDTVLTAILTQATQLRMNEFAGTPRAGFCMMGACQDCWVTCADGRRLRACSTFIEAGMDLRTGRVVA